MTHARARVLDRIPGVCPDLLLRGIRWAAVNNRSDILHFMLTQECGLKVYWGTAATGQPFTAIFDPENAHVVTVMDGWHTPKGPHVKRREHA